MAVIIVRPTANHGTLAVLWSIGGSSPPASPWLAVDEDVANDGVDFIFRQSSNAQHIFLIPSPNIPAGSTNLSVTVKFRGQRTAAGGANIQSRLAVGAVAPGGSSQAMTTSWADYTDTTWLTNNPGTSAPWTLDELNQAAASNNLVGVGVGSAGLAAGEEVQCTQLEVHFGHTPPVSNGSMSGSGSLSAVGRSEARGTGALTGTGGVSTIGRSDARGTGSASGVGDLVAWPPLPVGVMSGVGTLSAVGRAEHRASGLMSGQGGVAGQGAAYARAIASCAGAAVVVGVGQSHFRATMTAAGSAIVSATGKSHFRATGTLDGAAVVLGASRALARATGALSGAGTLAGVGQSQARAIGTMSGVGVLLAIAPEGFDFVEMVNVTMKQSTLRTVTLRQSTLSGITMEVPT